jgi:hypothetical protein
MKDLLNMNPLYGEQFRTLMTLTGGRARALASGAGGLAAAAATAAAGPAWSGGGDAGAPGLACMGASWPGRQCHGARRSPTPAPAPRHPSPPGSIDLNDLSRLVDAAASLTSAEDSVLQASGRAHAQLDGAQCMHSHN